MTTGRWPGTDPVSFENYETNPSPTDGGASNATTELLEGQHTYIEDGMQCGLSEEACKGRPWGVWFWLISVSKSGKSVFDALLFEAP